MPHIKVNGITINVTASGNETLRIGEITTSFGGQKRRSVRVLRDGYPFTTGRYALSESRALRALVEGRGHTLSFDTNTTTSRGLAVAASTGALTITASGKFGSYLNVAVSGKASWAVLPSTAEMSWGALLWRKEIGVWVHYFVHYGAVGAFEPGFITYKDGVLQVGFDPTTEFIRRRPSFENQIEIGDFTGTGPRDFDDVVLLDWAPPSAWASALYTWHNINAWSALPAIKAEGDRLPTGGQTVLGEPDAAGSLEFRESNAWTLGETFDFTLTETTA